MSDPSMTDTGIDWLEYMRGIENGNVVPTLEHLKAVCKAARENHDEMAEALKQARNRLQWIQDVQNGKATGLPQVDYCIKHIDSLLDPTSKG